MRRRGLAVLLALVMLLAALPAWAVAADDGQSEIISVTTDNKGAAQVSGSQLEKAVDSALASGDGAVEIQVKLPKEPDFLEVSLPVEAMETLGSHKGATLTMVSSLADVSLDHEAMAAIVNQAQGETAVFTLAPVSSGKLSEHQRQIVNGAPVYELTLVCAGKEINTFGGGKVTVTLPYEKPQWQKAAGVVVWSMDEYSRLTDCETSYDSTAKEVTFSTRHFSLYVVGYEEPLRLPFTDVPGDYWAYGEILWAYEKNVVTGKTDTLFQPEGTMTRQQVWMMLARLSGAAPASMAEAKAWAMKGGITDGSNPGGVVTRQQLVTLLYRFTQMMNYSVEGKASLANYPDAGSIASYAKDAMAWAVGNNVVSGTTQGYLNPNVLATRANFCVILWRYWGIVI